MPKSYLECPRNIRVNFYSTAEEKAHLDAEGAAMGSNATGYIRALIRADVYKRSAK